MSVEDQESFSQLRDENDLASAIEAQFIENAIAEAKRKSGPETHPDFDGEHCIDCDESIAPARLELGKIRCIDCQVMLEKRMRLQS